jgi:hypothetical protein
MSITGSLNHISILRYLKFTKHFAITYGNAPNLNTMVYPDAGAPLKILLRSDGGILADLLLAHPASLHLLMPTFSFPPKSASVPTTPTLFLPPEVQTREVG